MRALALALALAGVGAAAPALAQDAQLAAAPARPALTGCDVSGTCEARLTADQLFGYVQQLVARKDYAAARVALAALEHAPGHTLERRFLTGFVAQQTGNFETAISNYRAILADDPRQTRVRLELAGILLQQGKTASADHHFKLVAADQGVPQDILQLVRGARQVIRTRRAWSLNVDFGIAPDSNINNATALDGVTLTIGDIPFDFTLDEAAKARSGTGQTGAVQAGLRLPVARNMAMLVDIDTQGTNYAGGDFDDFSTQIAAGPEFRLSQVASISAQAVGAQRWYGGDVASRQLGMRLSGQLQISSVSRAGLQLDARRTQAPFDSGYDGWQVGLYGSYEHVVTRSAIASANLFVRRDALNLAGYANVELGGGGGIAAELPAGFNASLSGSVSRALYDAPIPLFGADPRRDWRLQSRLTIGNRKLQWLGFSPAVSLSYQRIDSGIAFFGSERLRAKFGVSRYF